MFYKHTASAIKKQITKFEYLYAKHEACAAYLGYASGLNKCLISDECSTFCKMRSYFEEVGATERPRNVTSFFPPLFFLDLTHICLNW